MDIRKGKSFDHSHLSQIIKITILGALIVSGLFAFNQFKLTDYFPIKIVRVHGINRADQQEIQDVLLPLVDHGFFAINIEYIRDRLLQMPWVSNIFVRRDWPDKIEITVVEKKPVARWNEESLLSEMGELFSPKKETYPTNLPQFIGPSGQQLMMLNYFTEMNRLFLPLHVKIAYLELTPYLTWNLALDNGIAMRIGHKDILTRLGHFVKVYPKIVGKHADGVDYIDLRYANGVAVKWKQAEK